MLPLAVVVATGPAAPGDNPTSPGAAGRLSFSLKSLAAGLTLVAAALLVSACGTAVEGTSNLAGLLPDGQRPNWYWNRMESSGYEVTAVSYQQNDYVEYKVVKGDESYEVQLELDPSGTAAKVKIVEGEKSAATTAADTGAAPEDAAAAGSDSADDDNPPAVAEGEAVERIRETIAVPAGTRIVAKLGRYLDSGENQRGDAFSMNVAESVVVDEAVAIPVGTRINGYVESVESAQRPNKGGRLVLKPSSIELSGEAFQVEGVITAEVGEQGRSSLKEDLKEIAGGAGIGGLVGGLIGGGKGALAGVLIGGGGMFVATKGEQIELAPDTELIVELRAPVDLPR